MITYVESKALNEILWGVQEKKGMKEYSEINYKGAVFVYIHGSSFCDKEISMQLLSCLYNFIIHAAPIIGIFLTILSYIYSFH